MGAIVASMELENAGDRGMSVQGLRDEAAVRRTRVDGIVDAGGVTLVLPQNVVERLGLATQRTVIVTYADEEFCAGLSPFTSRANLCASQDGNPPWSSGFASLLATDTGGSGRGGFAASSSAASQSTDTPRSGIAPLLSGSGAASAAATSRSISHPGHRSRSGESSPPRTLGSAERDSENP